MKKVLGLLVVLGLFFTCLIYNDKIISYLVNTFTDFHKDASTIKNNNYASNNSYDYVQLTNDFNPKSKKDIINIYYTVINSGMDNFTFYCPNEYKNCIKDVDYISNNQALLSDVNNFVPVYNSFENIDTVFDSLGKVNINITHNYTNDQITSIENKIDEIYKEIITEDMNSETKIKAIHDYIINNTKYDIDRSDNKVTKYHSDTAYGALIEKYSICGGYADSMKLFLDRLHIPNYKISSENHIWNLVKLDNEWYHLDLTWDDPVTSTGENVLEYDYFLITTDELEKLETDQHIFDKNIYTEAL